MTRFSRQILARVISDISSSRLLVKFQTYFKPTFACRELNALMNTWRFAPQSPLDVAQLLSKADSGTRVCVEILCLDEWAEPLDNLSCLPRCAPPSAKSNRPWINTLTTCSAQRSRRFPSNSLHWRQPVNLPRQPRISSLDRWIGSSLRDGLITRFVRYPYVFRVNIVCEEYIL